MRPGRLEGLQGPANKGRRICGVIFTATILICQAVSAGIAGAVPILTVLSPNGGETFRVGDTMTVTWRMDSVVAGAVIVDISANDGLSWVQLGGASTGTAEYAAKTFKWEVSSAAFDASNGGNLVYLISTHCMIAVHGYFDKTRYQSASAFTITDQAVMSENRAIGRSASDEAVVIHRSQGNDAVFDLRGRLLVRGAGTGALRPFTGMLVDPAAHAGRIFIAQSE